MVLNGEHTIVRRLDIYSKVGRGVAHDEIIPFKVKDGKLEVKGEESDLYYNKIGVEFIKVGFLCVFIYFLFLHLDPTYSDFRGTLIIRRSTPSSLLVEALRVSTSI